MLQRISGLCVVLAMLALVSAVANGGASSDGVVVLGGSDQSQADQTCVQVKVTGEAPSAYGCLNQQLQQDVAGASAARPEIPLGPNSASNQLGIFNEQSLAEQYGQNFGRSAVPYRPAAPSFDTSLHP
jgi:hypothetical protein